MIYCWYIVFWLFWVVFVALLWISPSHYDIIQNICHLNFLNTNLSGGGYYVTVGTTRNCANARNSVELALTAKIKRYFGWFSMFFMISAACCFEQEICRHCTICWFWSSTCDFRSISYKIFGLFHTTRVDLRTSGFFGIHSRSIFRANGWARLR